MNTLTKVPTPASTSPTYALVLTPASFSELVQFAQMAAKSQLVPKEYRNQPEDIMLAVQLGSEVGLRPMQALQNIAVINGRPAVWGDALPGLCKASPVYHDIVETWENEHEPDALVAVCIAKRHGSTPVTARFSVMDAKRAGLWTKAGPWQTYPRRMLQMRARSFALRDAFPDVLKGLISVEEALDNHAGAGQLAPAHDRRHRRASHARVATRATSDVSADHQAGHDDLPDWRGMAVRLGQARPWLQGRPCAGQAADRAPDEPGAHRRGGGVRSRARRHAHRATRSCAVSR